MAAINLFYCLFVATAFLWPWVASFTVCPTTTTRLPSRLWTFYDDFEDFARNTEQDEDDVKSFYGALRQRQQSLERSSRFRSAAVWRSKPTAIEAIAVQGDWIRRVAVDSASAEQPQQLTAVAGGASGSLYLLDLTTGKMLGKALMIHIAQEGGNFLDRQLPIALSYLYGDYDGGGVVAIARYRNLVASAGREGGVQISRVKTDSSSNKSTNDSNDRLVNLGKISGLSALCTSLAFDHKSNILWAASYQDRKIRGYQISSDMLDSPTPAVKSGPKLLGKTVKLPLVYDILAPSGLLSLSVQPEINCGVAATAKDGVLLFSLQDGSRIATWDPFEDKDLEDENSNDVEYARSVVLVQNDEQANDDPPSWSVVVGGSLGSIHQRQLTINPIDGTISTTQPWNASGPPHAVAEQFQHSASVICLASPGPRVFLSGAQDGTIRVWDCSYNQVGDGGFLALSPSVGGVGCSRTRPTPLFGLAGYKVWLGSLAVLNDGVLITDGADNAVVKHSFKED
jgi:WD40 repeat protein